MSLCAFANGFPVWLNLMLSILDEIEANIGDIQKQAEVQRVRPAPDPYRLLPGRRDRLGCPECSDSPFGWDKGRKYER